MIKVKIDKILKEQDKSLYWLAKATELSYPTIHRLVNNKTSSISFDTLEKICLALDVDIEDILKIVK